MSADAGPRAAARVRTAGWLCLWAGVLGALSGVYLSVVEPAVPADQWSYPLAPGQHAAIQTFFAVQHLGLLAGIVGLAGSGALAGRRWATRANTAAVAGMAALAVTELVAILPAEQDTSATFPMVLGGVYGLVSTVLGVALTVAGVGVLRAGVWTGWARWVPLALGVWVFVPMFPGMALSYLGARLTIGGW
ncbi:MAG: hypothetical protein WAW88_12775, partial [Nocardioides sp.]